MTRDRLRRIANRLEMPMALLAFVWIGLAVADLAGYENAWLSRTANAIWAIFIADFVLRFALARAKGLFLRRNWLTAVSLLLPALRILRIFRIVRAARGLRLLRVATSARRSIRALMRSMGRKGLPYVVALTAIVTIAGAAGMYALEDKLFKSFGDALWWTAMIMTTMGSEAWPHTPGGRMLCLGLALYAFSVFGYVTAALASFLVERAPHEHESDGLAEELRRLRAEVSALSARLEERSPLPPPQP